MSAYFLCSKISVIAISMKPGQKICDPCFFLPTRISVIILAAIQGGILNYYLVHYKNHSWYAWIAGDVAIVLSFFAAFFISYRELRIVFQANYFDHTKTQSRLEPGSFPLVYFAWLVYSVILAVRVALIYKNFAFEIETGIFFGTNMLKFIIAMAGILFLLVVAAHHNATPGTTARNQINLLSAMVPFDIIDAVDILSVFFIKESRDALEPVFEWSVIIIACFNLVLPTLPLMMLSGTRFGVQRVSPSINTLHKLLHIFVINAPLLSVRILMWHKQNEEVSPLVVKNIVMIVMVAMDFYEGDGEDKIPVVVEEEEREEMPDGHRADQVPIADNVPVVYHNHT